MGNVRIEDGVLPYETVDGTRVPTWKIFVPSGAQADHRFFPIKTLVAMGGIDLLSSAFRGIPMSRLDSVLSNGVDVTPTDRVIYVDNSFSKAWEYGGWPKIVLVYNWKKLDWTYREVHADVAPDELASLQATFPSILKSKEGTKLWLSRFEQSDPHIAGPYEEQYARWIPGNPFDALKAILLFHSDRVDEANT